MPYQFTVVVSVEQLVRSFYDELYRYLVSGQQPPERGVNFETILGDDLPEDVRVVVTASRTLWLALLAEMRRRDTEKQAPLVEVGEQPVTDLDTGEVVQSPA